MLVQSASNYFFDALEGSCCDFILLPVGYGKLTNIISETSLIIIYDCNCNCSYNIISYGSSLIIIWCETSDLRLVGYCTVLET